MSEGDPRTWRTTRHHSDRWQAAIPVASLPWTIVIERSLAVGASVRSTESAGCPGQQRRDVRGRRIQVQEFTLDSVVVEDQDDELDPLDARRPIGTHRRYCGDPNRCGSQRIGSVDDLVQFRGHPELGGRLPLQARVAEDLPLRRAGRHEPVVGHEALRAFLPVQLEKVDRRRSRRREHDTRRRKWRAE